MAITPNPIVSRSPKKKSQKTDKKDKPIVCSVWFWPPEVLDPQCVWRCFPDQGPAGMAAPLGRLSSPLSPPGRIAGDEPQGQSTLCAVEGWSTARPVQRRGLEAGYVPASCCPSWLGDAPRAIARIQLTAPPMAERELEPVSWRLRRIDPGLFFFFRFSGFFLVKNLLWCSFCKVQSAFSYSVDFA